MTFTTARSVSVTGTPPLGGPHEGAALATPTSRFERLMNESPRLCRGMVTTRYALVRKAVAYKGQLLLTVKGSGVGKMTICDLPEVAISRQLMAMTAIEWESRFLVLVTYLLAETLRKCARSLIPGIAREDVEAFVAALPPLVEQHRIVAKVDELMTLCDQLEAQLTITQADNRRLLEAVLHKALDE